MDSFPKFADLPAVMQTEMKRVFSSSRPIVDLAIVRHEARLFNAEKIDDDVAAERERRTIGALHKALRVPTSKRHLTRVGGRLRRIWGVLALHAGSNDLADYEREEWRQRARIARALQETVADTRTEPLRARHN